MQNEYFIAKHRLRYSRERSLQRLLQRPYSSSPLQRLDSLFSQPRFGAELHELEKKMIVAGQDFTIQIQELINQIEQATAESELKTKVKAERAQDEASAKGDLATTENDLATDTKYLKDLITECDQKAKDFENRQMLRKDELIAIHKAIEIMSSDEVMGTGEKHLPQFLQLKSTKSSMSMLRSSADAPLRKKLVSFLSQRAKETRSRLLAHLASRAAAGGPFDKVKKMIKDMIVKLMEEATEESEHKGWCDTEMGTNKQTREDKADAVSTLTAESEELDAKISKLGDEIAELFAGSTTSHFDYSTRLAL